MGNKQILCMIRASRMTPSRIDVRITEVFRREDEHNVGSTALSVALRYPPGIFTKEDELIQPSKLRAFVALANNSNYCAVVSIGLGEPTIVRVIPFSKAIKGNLRRLRQNSRLDSELVAA